MLTYAPPKFKVFLFFCGTLCVKEHNLFCPQSWNQNNDINVWCMRKHICFSWFSQYLHSLEFREKLFCDMNTCHSRNKFCQSTKSAQHFPHKQRKIPIFLEIQSLLERAFRLIEIRRRFTPPPNFVGENPRILILSYFSPQKMRHPIFSWNLICSRAGISSDRIQELYPQNV